MPNPSKNLRKQLLRLTSQVGSLFIPKSCIIPMLPSVAPKRFNGVGNLKQNDDPIPMLWTFCFYLDAAWLNGSSLYLCFGKKTAQVAFCLLEMTRCCPLWYPIPSQKTNRSPTTRHFWVDDFPFPQVGYVIVPWRVAFCLDGMTFSVRSWIPHLSKNKGKTRLDPWLCQDSLWLKWNHHLTNLDIRFSPLKSIEINWLC